MKTFALRKIAIYIYSLKFLFIFNYINQFGCSKLKRIVCVDMSPYLRNDGWKGGISQGKWTDEDFLSDLDRMFDDVGYANWYISKEIMVPDLKKVPKEFEPTMIENIRNSIDPFVMASLWYSLFRTDQRSFIQKNYYTFFIYNA